MCRARSSCSWKMSPSDTSDACVHRIVPAAASISCALHAQTSPARSSVPLTTRSTSASAAIVFKSGTSAAKRAAVNVERQNQRLERRERVGDGVGQAEGQKVDLGIGPQQPEGQHDDSRGPAAGRPRCPPHKRVRRSSAIAAALGYRSPAA